MICNLSNVQTFNFFKEAVVLITGEERIQPKEKNKRKEKEKREENEGKLY